MRLEHAHVISGKIIGYKIAYIVLINSHFFLECEVDFGKTWSFDNGGNTP